MFSPFQVWMAAVNHFLNVTEIKDYPLSSLFGTYSFGNKSLQTSSVGFVAAISVRINHSQDAAYLP